MKIGIRFLAVGVTLLGCATSPGREYPLTPEQQQVAAQISTLMQNDPCDNEHRHQCEYDLVAAPANRLPVEGDEVIMVIDEGLKNPTLALHSSRVLAHFRATNGPEYYVAHTPQAYFPKTARKILHEVLRGKEELASTKPFKALGETFSRKYGKLFEGNNLGHGTTSFNVLAELNPQAKFVIVHTDSALHDVPLCQLNQWNGEAQLLTYWSERATALAQIARDYRVKAVNYSMGYDLKAVQDLWQKKGCGGSRPGSAQMIRYVEMTNLIPEKLSEIPGLLFSQAAPYPTSEINDWNKSNFAADCKALPQRIRVGYLNLREDTLRDYDRRNSSLLSGVMKNAYACTDLYVRDGLAGDFESSDSPVYYTALGFGHGAMNLSGSSFINPVGLSHALYLMKRDGQTPAQYVTAVRGRDNEPLLVAPFAQKEFLNQNRLYLSWPE